MPSTAKVCNVILPGTLPVCRLTVDSSSTEEAETAEARGVETRWRFAAAPALSFRSVWPLHHVRAETWQGHGTVRVELNMPKMGS